LISAEKKLKQDSIKESFVNNCEEFSKLVLNIPIDLLTSDLVLDDVAHTDIIIGRTDESKQKKRVNINFF